jgi:hypothetical protein
MSDERSGWAYCGRVDLVGQGVDRIPVDVDLHIEVERDSIDGVLPPLKSWCGTGRVPAEYRDVYPVGQFTLVLPDGQQGDVYVNADVEGPVLSLELQGVGAPPWLAA